MELFHTVQVQNGMRCYNKLSGIKANINKVFPLVCFLDVAAIMFMATNL
jgi:hypothetical protein